MELLDALKMIRDECKKHDECAKCPLRDRDDLCYLEESGDTPNAWVFIDDVPTPRLFA